MVLSSLQLLPPYHSNHIDSDESLERTPMRNVAHIKLGYCPLPLAEGSRLRQLLNFPLESASVVALCAGTGSALNAAHRGRQHDTLRSRARLRACATGERFGHRNHPRKSL